MKNIATTEVIYVKAISWEDGTYSPATWCLFLIDNAINETSYARFTAKPTKKQIRSLRRVWRNGLRKDNINLFTNLDVLHPIK